MGNLGPKSCTKNVNPPAGGASAAAAPLHWQGAPPPGPPGTRGQRHRKIREKLPLLAWSGTLAERQQRSVLPLLDKLQEIHYLLLRTTYLTNTVT